MRRNDTISLNEVSFYNTNGDEINISNLVNQMINYFNMKHEVGETNLTDFNEGSEIRNILEAFAVLEYARLEEEKANSEIAFINSSYGMWLDRIGELPFIDLPRSTGETAIGTVTFTLAEAQESDYVVPAGTVVTDSSNDIDFVTLADATVLEGETSVDVNVECLDVGSDGNVPAGNIDTIDVSSSIDTDLVSVSNEDACVGGEDYELDDDYRERLLGNVQAEGFGSLPYYKDLCESLDGVHDVLLVADNSYTRKVLVNGYSKPTPDSVLLDVLSELTLQDNIVLGHNFIVDKPTYTTVDLTVTLDVVTPVSTSDLTSVLTVLFDGGDASFPMSAEGLTINESLSKDRIVGALGVFEDVVDVTSVKQSGSEITSLTPASNGVLKLGTVSFTQNEV